MASVFDQLPQRQALASIARDFHLRGWMAGTAGNLSVRANDRNDCFWITASGQPKGSLDENDFLLIQTSDAEVITKFNSAHKPSAETSIHQTIFKLFPDAAACFHIHSVHACLATSNVPTTATEMTLPALEMIKGLGIFEQDPHVELPLFDNILDVTKIAKEIEYRFMKSYPQIPALMIREHGITVWGDSLQQTYNRVEIVEFLMSYLAQRALSN